MFSNRPRPWPTARAVLVPIWLSPWVIGLWLGGCSESPKQTLIDSEQRRFVALCGKAGTCSVTPEATYAPAPGEATAAKGGFAVRATGRVVGICGPVSTGSPSGVEDCRPLVCENNADCPPAQGLTHGVCINQLCTEPSHAIIAEDAIMLCLAGTGAGPRTALQVERLALGVNCGTPCQIPKPCRPF